MTTVRSPRRRCQWPYTPRHAPLSTPGYHDSPPMQSCVPIICPDILLQLDSSYSPAAKSSSPPQSPAAGPVFAFRRVSACSSSWEISKSGVGISFSVSTCRYVYCVSIVCLVRVYYGYVVCLLHAPLRPSCTCASLRALSYAFKHCDAAIYTVTVVTLTSLDVNGHTGVREQKNTPPGEEDPWED